MTLSDYLSKPGISAVGIARQLGISHTTVLRWRDGQVPPERVGDLARITGLTPADLRPDLAAVFGEPRPATTAQAAE
jgi:DNA-binding transcriptional regulator YdaS (Cro superfamily)